MGLIELEYDGLSWKYFEDILVQYHPQFPVTSGRRLYLPTTLTANGAADEYYRRIEFAARNSNSKAWTDLFLTYRDFTSGSTGEKKDCLRPSISIHLELLRLRDILDYFVKMKSARFSERIYYYSRYGTNTFRYVDDKQPRIEMLKYVYSNIEHLHDELEERNDPFILSGTPSSIIDLLEIGFGRFSPELVIIAGEECPEDVQIRIEQELAPTINLIVTREFGLLGCKCPTTDRFHFFSNSVRCVSDSSGRLRVTEPLNYCMRYKNYSIDDFVEGFSNDTCICGFQGACASEYKGRSYRKAYPPL